MPERSRRGARRALALVGALLAATCARDEGPAPIVFDREPCASCRMLISEPRFAAQLETKDGLVESFDDPGCLLAHLDAQGRSVRRLWFHHVREERWIEGSQVGFEPGAQTPMGYGLAAVDVNAPGALTLEEARARIAAGASRAGDAP